MTVGGAWAAVDRGLQPMTFIEGGLMFVVFVLLGLIVGLLLLALDLAGGG